MDLSTTYMGLHLKNPIVPSASPLTREHEAILQMEDNGAAAVVLHSLFEEQISHESRELDHYLSYGCDCNAEALSYFPEMQRYNIGPEEYLNAISRAKQAVDIPVIASLNGQTAGGWLDYAREIEQAGADALELNIYLVPTSPELDSAAVEQIYLDIIEKVAAGTGLPIAVKIPSSFSAPLNIAQRMSAKGARALVLFNHGNITDFDLDELEVVARPALSSSKDLRKPLLWTAIFYGQVEADLAISGGIHTGLDILKGLMAGANVTMLASELLTKGIGRISELLEELQVWMHENEYTSVQQMQGSMSRLHVADPTVFERENYMKVLTSWRQDPTGTRL